MKNALRKKTIRYFLPWLISTAVIAIVLLATSCQGMVLRMSGAKLLNEYNSDTISNGQYVSFDASEVIVACASLSYSNDSGSTVQKTYYLLPFGENHYIAVVDHKEKNSDVLNRAMEQSYEYYMGDLETLKALGSLSGTVTALEDDMTGYMVSCIDEYTLPGYEDGADSAKLIYPYQIDLDKIGFLSGSVGIVLFVIGLVFLVIMLIVLIPVCMGAYQKKAILQVRELLSEEEAENAFNSAVKIENLVVGDYIWYQKKATTRVIKTSDIIWGYAMPEPLVVSKYRWPVALYNKEQQLTQVYFMDKKNCKKLLDLISAQGNPFVSGYTVAYSQLFTKDLDAFISLGKELAEAAEAVQSN